MKKIYLIQPPIEDFYTTPIRNIPLGLIQIGTVLKSSHKVKIFDLRYNKKKKINPPEIFKPLLKYYHGYNASPFSLYKNYYRFGYNTSEFVKNLDQPPDYFAISSPCTTYSETSLELISAIKNKFPNSTIIAGGTDASIRPEVYFDAGADFVMKGEGEFSLLKLLKAIEKRERFLESIENLVWEKGSKKIYNHTSLIKDLDTVPFPDYSLDGLPEYIYNGKRHAMIMAGRGCPYRCKFCSIAKTMGYNTRLRSVENVVEEIAEKVKIGITSFDFEDDNFGHNKKWLNDFLDYSIKYFKKDNLHFYAMNGITASNVDETILTKMKEAGFQYINLSLVNPEPAIQKKLKRPFTTSMFLEVINHANKIGLPVIAYLILGMPGDTVEKMLNAILFLASTQCLIGPSIFYITPESEMYNELKEKGKLPQNVESFRATCVPYTDENFTREDIITLFAITRIVNFIKYIIDRKPQPAEFEIKDHKLFIKNSISGSQTRITIGLALLKLLFEEGKLYYTGKKTRNYYPLIEENVSKKILRKLFDTRWTIKGYLTSRSLSLSQLCSLI